MLGEMQILDAAYHYCVYARSTHLFNFLPNNGKDYGRKTNYFGSSCQMEFFLTIVQFSFILVSFTRENMSMKLLILLSIYITN